MTMLDLEQFVKAKNAERLANGLCIWKGRYFNKHSNRWEEPQRVCFPTKEQAQARLDRWIAAGAEAGFVTAD